MSSLLFWLNSVDLYPKIYWKDRKSSKAVAGVGMGGEGEFFGWRHFSKTKAPHWSDFPSRFLFAPKILKESDEPSIDLDFVKPEIKKTTHLPTKSEWFFKVNSTLEAIRKRKLDKVVLARECRFDLEKPLNPWPLISKLQARASNAYLFCLQMTPRSAFLAVTPERLFFRSNRTLQTEALAGTRKLGESDLLDHPKERREFSLVEDSIRWALSPLSSGALSFSLPAVRANSTLQHLYSDLKAELKTNVTDTKILDRLHPTAALLGFPKSKAMKHLESLESFDRGLYGAPLGRMNHFGSEWIVGIRSCLLFGSTARLYSGAGIVAGSDPESEWNELESKLQLYQGIFL